MAHQRQPIKLYLFGYNSLQAAGWIVAIFMLLSNLLSTKSIAGTFASAGEIIWILQTAAFLEVVHGAVQDHPSLFITFLAWCLIEVIRYPFYALNTIGACPHWLTYLRYTMFIPLYPIGVLGEMLLLNQAFPYMKEKNIFANFFAGLPFSYYNVVQVVFVMYPFAWIKLYSHMLKQRGSKLGKRQEKKKK
ncbi:very-long-chain (3R)-3-hydroxyacyl-CoA dehydratase 2 isoform X2 [Citrus clementina]|uniref:very-long-chain (3R)-3-hydroxyacyl-CoA dehydratase 2 isoform X2 n=1 Tax=Citrus clementina TaxID=85681 RepID=UPI000CED15F2|nr:very-long-chain (3R)-3-hydroxyacyl-CoA dehydratase 2 isoform X2 [Citrus x clementina]